MSMEPVNYQDNFFEYHLKGAISSAQAVIPIVKEYINPSSVIDIGCGIGAWLSIWKKNGVKEVMGMDGNYVDLSKLLVEKAEFKAQDLEKNFVSQKKYELITCLEVAEHLHEQYAESFIRCLCMLGDVILFSAAIPGQGGTQHWNEQYPAYWAKLFKLNGFIPVDCIRLRIWDNPDVMWWYRQNIIFFVKETRITAYPKLKESAIYSDGKALSLIHPEMLRDKIKKVDEYEEILHSGKITLKYFLNNIFKRKRI